MPPGLDPRLFDDTVAAVALLAGPEHRLLYTNAAFARMLGARPLGLPARKAFPEADAEEFLTVLDDVRATGRARQLTDSREPDPGATEQARYFVYSCSPVTTAQGPGVLVVTMDTTAETCTLQRYEALVSAVTQMVWVMHRDGTMDELVPGWEELTGVPWHPIADESWLAHVHPRDGARVTQVWKDATTQVTSDIVEYTFRVRTADGSYRHLYTRAVPVVRDGQVEEWVAANLDVEDTWRAWLRERLITQVAAVTGPGLNDAFAEVVKVVVPELTDACLILLLSHDTWPLPEHARVTARRVASATRPGLPAPPALRNQSVLVAPALREILDKRIPRTFRFPAGGPVPPHLLPAVTERWLAATGATSLTLVPLAVDDVVLGYAATSTNGDTPMPGPADIELLRDVLHHAQQPIRKVLDLQHARRTALGLQRAHLTRPPDVPGAELAASYQPASSADEIGGDWYDAFLLPDQTLVLDVGDVAGHDLTAATAMGQMRSMLRALAYRGGPKAAPAMVLSRLDEVADGLGITPFTTAVHAHLTRQPAGTWLLAWSNAGHPPPLLIPHDGDPRYLTGTGEDPPLCVAPRLLRSTHTWTLQPGDTLLLYTDGLIETPGASLSDGQRELARTAAHHRHEPLPELLCLLQDLSDDRDDAAMIAFRTGVPGGTADPDEV
ncbi:SpoIIE family protein phosphatase [Streptomyces sp. NBC_01304]|uniref:SpoIIE family protein phosphatase n=1 Tax=Streptomyces sp. NBC_01304 TaxID=2903818 RepID=UPI002E137583|nr:SpoIIE family protein phosphatase [Streptomyces sp. NBC_01304]